MDARTYDGVTLLIYRAARNNGKGRQAKSDQRQVVSGRIVRDITLLVARGYVELRI